MFILNKHSPMERKKCTKIATSYPPSKTWQLAIQPVASLMLLAASLVSAWQAPASLRGVSSPLRSASLVRMDVTGEYLASTEDASLEVGAPMLTPPPAATTTTYRHCPAAVSATRLTCGVPSTGGVCERQGDRAGRSGDGAGRDGASAAEEA